MISKPSKITSEYKEAANENTPGDRLGELALNDDPLVRKKVAMNPNTPTEVLLDLGAEFPNELMDNIVFHLFVLENLELLVEKIPIKTLVIILETKRKIPLFLIERSAKLCRYRRGNNRIDELEKAIALHPQTPRRILLSLNLTSSSFREYIVQNPNLIAQDLETLAQRDINYKVRYYVAQHPNTSGHTLDWLTKDLKLAAGKQKDRLERCLNLIRKNVAENPNALEETLEELAKDRTKINDLGRDIRKGVAQNPNTSLKVLETLARDESDRVKMSVAVHPKFTVNLILKYISDDEKLANNIWEAKQRDTSVKMLEKLAKNESILVRLAVAKNPNTSAEAIETLWQKEVIYLISEAIYKHSNTPAKVLQELMPSI